MGRPPTLYQVAFTTYDHDEEEGFRVWLDSEDGRSWDKEKSGFVGYFGRATVFDLLIKAAAKMREETNGKRPENHESIWTGLTSKDKAYQQVWNNVGDDEKRADVFAV